ncbi:hypothetical protein JVU11DRAFT_9753 [Chiua virens]|nr:hypothetical protein JVU11DRAFT_9753 [Chiua virens]
MFTDENLDLKAQRLPALQELWEAVSEGKLFKKEQITDDDFVHYLDFGEHFAAVKRFCGPVRKKLCIYQEYLDAFKAFEDDSGTYENGACIIGQPGIGKTCFIAYAVIERIRKKKPVAVDVTFWEKSIERYLLFTAEGVTLHRSWDTDPLERHPGIWAFSDSDTAVVFPTAAFRHGLGVRTFQVTSPQQVRYKEWTKQSEISHYIMDIPSAKDIQHLSLVLGKDIAAMQSLAAKWGNVPRTLLGLYNNLDAQRSRERQARQQVDKSTKHMSRILDALSALDATSFDEPSAIFFIQPFRMEDGIIDRQDHCILIPTPWLQDQVADGLLRREEGERVELFRLLTGSLKTRTAAENVFESIVHKVSVRGQNIAHSLAQDSGVSGTHPHPFLAHSSDLVSQCRPQGG